MKKVFLLGLLLIAAVSVNAQYSQNFDGLSHGDYIGVQDANWTTWSGTTGGSEDAQVDSSMSKSPNNSIYFMSTSANGGPQDAVLEFGQAYDLGTFVYEMALYITPGKGAYFNFQAETTIGTTWALDANFIQDSMLYLNDQSVIYLSTNYPVGQWFDLKFDIDLSTNNWMVYIDNNLVGSFANAANKVASVDFFPMCNSNFGGNGQSEFWVDDVSYTHTPFTLPATNAGVTNVGLNKVAISGLANEPKVKIRNLGTNTITSFDLEIDYNGTQTTQSFSGLSIASLDFHEVIVNPGITVASSSMDLTATITSVNGMTGDDYSSDDDKSVTIDPITPAPGRVVVVEEATGTWCGYCPRGAVAMDFLGRDYHGIAAGIAIHNGDPMVFAPYDAGIGAYIGGYPSALVNRENDIDPSAIFPDVNASLMEAPKGVMLNGAEYNPTSMELKVSLHTEFSATANAGWKIACVLTEDSVTGTGSGYSQSNYYSGGSMGDLIGPDGVNWANLPSSVPASQMVYNHVARSISPSFAGYPQAFPATINIGDTFTHNFTFTLDPNWDMDKMHIVGLLIRPNGKIGNGSISTVAEAIANGFISGTMIIGAEEFIGPDATSVMFPNPVNRGEAVNITVNSNEALIQVFDIQGKLLISEEHSMMDGATVNFSSASLTAGTYIVKVTAENATETHRLVIVE